MPSPRGIPCRGSCLCNPEHRAWCTVKVTQSGEGEGGWEIEPQSEAKCEKGSPERERVAASSVCSEKEAGEWAQGKKVKGAEKQIWG